MKYQMILNFVLILTLAVSQYSCIQTTHNTDRVVPQHTVGNDVYGESNESSYLQYDIPDFQYLPPGWIAEVYDSSFSWEWHISATFYDRSNPKEEYNLKIIYNVLSDETITTISSGGVILLEHYTTADEFDQIINFLDVNSNQIFDLTYYNLYGGFSGLEGYRLNHVIHEEFHFSVYAGDSHDAASIMVWTETGAGLPQCFDDLFELLRTLYTDPLLGQAPANQPPVCDLLSVPPQTGIGGTPHSVQFDANGSFDPDGDNLTYHWDFDGDNVFDEPGDDDYSGDPEMPIHTFMLPPPGNMVQYPVNMYVEDPYGLTSIICTTIVMVQTI